MPSILDFNDDTLLKKYLAAQLNGGRIALVLGAGISMSMGLPSWENLLLALYKNKKSIPPSKKSYSDQAEAYQNKYYKNKYPEYLKAVSDALYKGKKFDFFNLKNNATLSAIGDLVIASRRGSASTVITFNFDDLLEMYLEYHGLIIQSIAEDKYWNEYSDVEIIHLHGLLPKSKRRRSSDRIIFDQKSYSDVSELNMPLDQAIKSIMQTHTCIFIGISGDDPHLDALLSSIEKKHAIHIDDTPYWGVSFSVDKSRDIVEKWKRRKIFLKCLPNFDEALPKFLFEICQVASQIK